MMRYRRMRAALFFRGCGVALMVCVTSPSAEAQTVTEKAAAESLFDQGRAAMQEGDFAKACGLLERSQRVDPGVGTLLYLAECFEKSGRTASAWATFREAADAATAVRDTNRARIGRERAARLEPQLSRLTVQVASEVQQITALAIERSGRGVQPAMWNVPVPVDPGDYTVTASAPGYEPSSQPVSIGDRAARVSVTIPLLKKAAESAPSSSAVTLPDPSNPGPLPQAPVPSAETAGSRGQGQRTIAYFVGGAGIVGVGLGTVFGLRAISKNREAKDHCPGYLCNDAQGESAASDAKTAARISDVAVGAGIAALVGGAVLYFTAPTSAPEAARTSVSAAVGPTGLSLWGSFQ